MTIKKIIFISLFAIIIIGSLSFAKEESAIKVQLNGEYLDFTDDQGNVVEPQLINNRTMVPLRKIFESLDCEIDWDQDTKTVTAVKEDREIKLTIDDNNAYLKAGSGDEKTIELDSAPVIIENRTLVPVRFIAESLEKEVEWDQENKTVIIIDFEEVVKIFEQKAPALKYVFDLKLDEVNSFDFTTTFDGKIKYSDSDDKNNNEELAIKGTLDGSVSGKDSSINIKSQITGKEGNILKAFKDAKYDNIDYKFVSKDDENYLGTPNEKNKLTWQAFEDENLKVISKIDFAKIKDYESLAKMLKESFEKVDINTYSNLMASFDQIGKLITNDNMKVVESKDKITFTINFDVDKMILNLASNSSVNVDPQLDMKAEIKLVKTKGVITSESTKLEFIFTAPNSKEKMDILINANTKYSNVNKEINIEKPKI